MDFDDFDDILDDLLEDGVDHLEVSTTHEEEEEDGEDDEPSASADLRRVMEPATTPSAKPTLEDNADKKIPVISNMDLPKKKTEMMRTTAATPVTLSTMGSSSPFSSSSSSSASFATPPKKASNPSRTRATPVVSAFTAATRTESPMRRKPVTKPDEKQPKKHSPVPKFSSPSRPAATARSTTTTTRTAEPGPSSSLLGSTIASKRRAAARRAPPTPPPRCYGSRAGEDNKPMKLTVPLNLGVANRPTKAWLAKQGLLPGQNMEDSSFGLLGFKRPGDKLSKADAKRAKHHHRTVRIPDRPTKAWSSKIAATRAFKAELESSEPDRFRD